MGLLTMAIKVELGTHFTLYRGTAGVGLESFLDKDKGTLWDLTKKGGLLDG